ncbi:class I SAM-dependent methyltransferase [Pedobacter glucosidilyticus]|uniref:class I SAM-dependent methyltransferase n=1 Tax=Pedobacter glucosidilyticus TaxID=1122941 RepID=UPI0004140D57|nr:class I SAM-dependent methyltransferase [Pedobacter glucosidilyticus]
MNKALLDKEVQDYIRLIADADVNKIILKGSPFKNIDVKEIANQIQGKKSTLKKLPLWANTDGIIYPPKLNLEQSSSEITALYKSKLVKNAKLVDLTGGFGVDDFYFAKEAKEVVHCELNPQLSALAKHNNQLLGAQNIAYYTGDSHEYLQKIQQTDIIYTDPSRRVENSKVFLLQDCEPNIIQHLDFYLSKASKIILKAAPILDIYAAVKALKYVSEIHVVSVNNECKELLFVIEKQASATKIICALLSADHQNILEFPYLEEENIISASYKNPETYLYEPDAAILKAGLFKSIAQKFNLNKLHQHSHVYTSTALEQDFPGRVLKIKAYYDLKQFSRQQIEKANVICRNFPLKPEEVKKKFKIKDGGDTYLYCTTISNGLKIMIIAERII